LDTTYWGWFVRSETNAFFQLSRLQETSRYENHIAITLATKKGVFEGVCRFLVALQNWADQNRKIPQALWPNLGIFEGGCPSVFLPIGISR
jgi:hypothetical protein